MARIALVLVSGLLVLTSCGDNDDPRASNAATPKNDVAAKADAAMKPADKGPSAAPAVAAGTKITARGSEFGRMLWGPKRQAIYIFQRDRPERSRCFGACAEAWPPVFTRGRPIAGAGVRKSLLGTTRRRGGRRQVTYAGKPLYYYAHEGPGQVLCHNVDLNGGLWWVLGPNGERRP